MKKVLSILMVMTIFFASSFTPKSANVHEVEADIVDLAVSTEFLSTLVAAVKAGDLVNVLKGDGPFTVFAPTNEAFAKLPAGTVENLLKPENKAQLVAVLTYHVVPGKVMSKDLKNGQKAKTVQGSEITVTLKDGKAMINNATVTAADIEASNGVVHVIDTVILPKM
ncbi:fasciclin domain-containing protein [Algoriphagus sp. A40]|uniref:fasciclin domain-containing protein n=1 Tax=Algoriphagus sp. A40 TaxID=1945863 RepID=UPI0009850191|nr:fasciclin domain-containing protein [Algoriphagus sp. A40]OOG78850.1 fasciclin [Algoriphagus sp. A40]